MTSDGFSVKTTISQLGNVARAQAKGQSSHADANTALKTLQQDKRVDRVKKTEETLQKQVDPDQHKKPGREGADDRDDTFRNEAASDNETEDMDTETSEDMTDSKGTMIDTKV